MPYSEDVTVESIEEAFDLIEQENLNLEDVTFNFPLDNIEQAKGFLDGLQENEISVSMVTIGLDLEADSESPPADDGETV